MYTIDKLRELIETELSKLEYLSEPKELFKPLQYILEGQGKRLRPLLVLMTYNMYNESVEDILTSAIGLEIFHNYTLLHDDVMDNAKMRRGKLTVHNKWNTNVAILSGDAAAIVAYKFILKCKDKYLREVITSFNNVAMDVCKGQQLDMQFETREDVSTEEYLHMIYLKTAVLIGGAVRHGAILGGASKDEHKALYDFGCNIGVAFQLQDDYLDIYGDSTKFGKKIGGDILTNKKTYMLIQTYKLADKETREELKFWMRMKSPDPQKKIEAITNIYNKIGIKEHVFNLINSYVNKGYDILKSIKVDEDKKTNFYNIISLLKDRKS